MLHWIKKFLSKKIDGHEQTSKKQAAQIDYTALFKTLNYEFSNLPLIEKALKHRSILPILGQKRVDSNERLELLGDAVLGLAVTQFLFENYTNKEEGYLTSMKSLLVSRKILARVGNDLGLGNYILLSDAEVKSGGRTRQSIVADALESVIGAIYLDGGLEPARSFIIKNILEQHKQILKQQIYKNFKSILLEYSQSRNYGAPFYIIRSEEGPDHNKLFTVEVRIKNTPAGVGVGNSKKRAEQRAAQNALEKLDSKGGDDLI